MAIKHVNFHSKTKTVFPKILKEATNQCFVHSIFRFWFIATFDVKVTQILRNLYLHFVRQEGRNWKENHTTKVTKIPKTKRREYGKQRNKNHLSE